MTKSQSSQHKIALNYNAKNRFIAKIVRVRTKRGRSAVRLSFTEIMKNYCYQATVVLLLNYEWPMKKTHEKRLEIAEMRMLRLIMGR